MDRGVGYFATGYGMDPVALTRLVEERGHRWLFPGRRRIPASRERPCPGGTELPRKYWHADDLFVAITGAAVATFLKRYAEAGVERVLSWLPSAREAAVESALDQVEAAMAELLGT
jgi:hypothetical protein